MTDRPDDREPLSSEELIRRARDGISSEGARDEEAAALPPQPPPLVSDDAGAFEEANSEGEEGDAVGGPSEDPALGWTDSWSDDPPPAEAHPAPIDDPSSDPGLDPVGYDADAWAELRRQTEEPHSDGADVLPPPDPETWTPPAPGYEPTATRTRPSGWIRFWLVGRWVIGAVVLIGLLGQCVSAGTSLDSLSVGDCFEDPGIGVEVSEVETVDCNQLHDFELFATVELGSDDRIYPGENALFQELEAECIERFPGYVGNDYLTSAYDFVTFTPVPEGWDAGDRTGMCAIYEFDGNFNLVKSIGTARNSGR